METLLQQILSLLTRPPGNLIYHLVVAFSIVSALQAALIGRRASGYAYTNRMIFGLSMLLLGQVVLYLSSGLAWQGILDERLILPALNRTILFISLVWLIWLWNFPAPAKLGDLVTGFLMVGAVVFFLFTYSNWSAQDPTLPFNNSWIDWAWVVASLAVVVIGMAILLLSRPPGWSFGLGMLALSLAGLVAHLLLTPSEGYLSGFIRLGQLAAFPLLPTLLNRLNQPTSEVELAKRPKAAPSEPLGPRARERRRYSSDPRTVHAWLTLLQTRDPEKVLSSMAKAFAHTMLADMCFIVGEPAYGHIVLQAGYDLIREEAIPGTMLDQTQLPALSNAISRGKVLSVTEVTGQPQEYKPLCSALGLSEMGSLMYIPFIPGENPHGGILFLSPYSKRAWTAEDQAYLASEYELTAHILQQLLHDQPQPAGQDANAMQAELDTLRQENERLSSQLAGGEPSERQPAAGLPANDLEALIALQREAQEQIAVLQSENERLLAAMKDQEMLAGLPNENEQIEAALRAMLQETAYLQNQLADANARYLMLEHELRQNTGSRSENAEVIATMVQDIRQPMASIVGYLDVLLSESVGILGTLQRRFLERIKSSVERIHGTLNDINKVIDLGQQPEEIQQSIDLTEVIDNAVAETGEQMREKDVALRVDLPEQLPELFVDRDAVQQIIVHLLQNAGAATPLEGTITLRTRIQEEDGENYLLIQVSDSGGGVHPEDLPRVFSRRLRENDSAIIQGLGETSIGLSIAKVLAEAHQGRIWVDSTYGQGTTFSVLIPVRSVAGTERQE